MHRIATRVCVAFVGLVVSFSVAAAADLPRPVYKAPLYSPVSVFSWTGFYIGANAGYGWSTFTGGSPGLGTDTVNAKGFLGGFQAGYNLQFGQFVVGVEGEYAFANVKFETPLFAGTLTLKNDYFATAAVRFGYAFDRILLYGKAGAAWTRDKWDGNDGAGGTATGTFNRTGWIFGAGLEWAFLGAWSAKLEYDYLMFGTISEILTTTGGLGVVGAANVKLRTQILKVGVNYRF